MIDGNVGGNGRKPVNGSARSSSHPTIVRLHETLDEIEQLLHGDKPMCDFDGMREEVAEVNDQAFTLKASLAEISAHRHKRRSKRPVAT
jgi:hypothetical protein